MEENEQLKSFLNELKEKVQWLEKEKKNVMKDVKIKETDFKLLSKEHKKVVLLMFFHVLIQNKHSGFRRSDPTAPATHVI